MELDADEVMTAVLDAMHTAVRGSGERVRALAVCTQRETVVPAMPVGTCWERR